MYPERPNPRNLSFTRLLCLAALLLPFTLSAQSVTEIITDYNGWWKSAHQHQSPVRPDNSHNLLAFKLNGVTYSTGVNDSLLTARGEIFVAGNFRSLPVHLITGSITGNTKIGLGAMYDGVANGAPASSNRPENNVNKYLTDGLHGLDLGTCVANLPAGQIFLPVSNLRPEAIGDGIPDLIITQIADPSTTSLDRYEFTDINGATIGHNIEIVLNNLKVVGHWMADFYEASTNPMQLSSGFTHTDRPIRLWAADFSEFGITADDLPDIAYFRIRLNGNSDVAFVAYNDNTINVMVPLPCTLSQFEAKPAAEAVQLFWETLSEQNTDRFVIETSTDGTTFVAAGSVRAAGHSVSRLSYSWTHRNPPAQTMYYRLRITDKDGRAQYSKAISANARRMSDLAYCIYPNPASEKITVKHPVASAGDWCEVRSLSGIPVAKRPLSPGTVQTTLDIRGLPPGTYLLVCAGAGEQRVTKFLKQ